MSFLTPTNRKRRGVANELFGPYRGVIEYNLDPMGIGRCKVRVPSIHSTEKSIETEELPWAWPVHSFGGFHDGGSFIIPPVGATVLVMFEQGDSQYPFYFGPWYKNPTDPREINTKTSKETGKTLPKKPISMGKWMQPIGPEIPKEAMTAPYNDPTVKVLLKSQKGHTIVVNDRDGFEDFRLIDRAGQEIIMHSPVPVSNNAGNAAQRGLKAASDGSALPYSKLSGQTATVDITGTNGQGFRIISSPNAEAIEIISKDDSALATPDGGKNRISVLIGGNLGVFEVVGTSGSEEMARISVDTRTGSIDIRGKGTMSLQADLLSLIADYVSLNGDVSVNGDLTVRGDAILSKRIIGGDKD